MSAPDHPAKFSAEVLAKLYEILPIRGRMLDPMAGIGGIHSLATPDLTAIGLEIECEWADAHPDTVWADSTTLRVLDEDRFEVASPDGDLHAMPRPTVVCSSFAYGNRMADSYAGDARGTRRFTYRISLGRPLSENNGAGLQWGEAYKELHRRVLLASWDVLLDGGLLALNMSDHIRDRTVQPVVAWYLGEITALYRARDINMHRVATKRMRHGANHGARVDHEWIITARKGESS